MIQLLAAGHKRVIYVRVDEKITKISRAGADELLLIDALTMMTVEKGCWKKYK